MRAWWLWVVGGGLISVAYTFLPEGTLAAALFYNGFGVLTVLVILLGVWRNRPENRRAWLVFAAGVAIFIAADITYEVSGLVLGRHPYPYWDDVLYFIGYPIFCVGLLLSARGRARHTWDLPSAIDSAVIATGVGLVYWVFLIGPTLADGGTGLLERLATVGYPICDVVMCALVTHLLNRAGGRSPAMVMLAAGCGINLVCDVIWQLTDSFTAYSGGLINAGFLLSYVCWAAAPLHPSTRPRRLAPPPGMDRFGRGRLALLAACTLLAPAVLFTQGARHQKINWVAIGVGAVALFLLVVARMAGFVGKVQHQAGKLEDLVMLDDLTGLANRRRFELRLDEAVAAGDVQVCVLDLNGFKTVNDRHGHAVGDGLLIAVAERLAGVMRGQDVVARMGGDDFALMVPGAAADEGDAIVRRIGGALRDPVEVSGHTLLISASIGIADATGTDDPVEVLRRADVAMYAAKASGNRRSRRYAPELDDQADEEAQVGLEMRLGLETGQFRMVYQPIVELPGGRTRYVESLVRWQHPERGFVSPADFVPIAEQNGLIVELGEWILRTACAQFVDWQELHGPDGPERISVNVSARQLAEPGFAAVVAEVLHDTGMPVSCLIVEVTETAVFGGGVAVQAVKDLHELGVRIALDDFGTGHSSLGLLQTVPVDVLKVDKSFVDNLTMAGRHAVIATALIQVSNGLGLSAVAEGVETAEQAAELHRLGYQFAQGYHFGRPVAEPDFRRPVEYAGGTERGLPAAVGGLRSQ